MIAAVELTRRFGDHVAVDGLSFEIAAGQIGVLIGPNGAGKSTTVKMLTGLLPPTSGIATLGGVRVGADIVAIKRICGVLPENLGLFDDLTVEEHLALTGAVYGVPRSDAGGRAADLMRLLDLERPRHTFIRNCSHGTRKKTALAMALLPAPRVLFLDEPFEAVDPVTARTIRGLLKASATRGLTVLLTSHILPLAETIADRVLFIRKGRLLWNSTPQDVPGSLEDLYFDLAEPAASEDLDWLRSPQS